MEIHIFFTDVVFRLHLLSSVCPWYVLKLLILEWSETVLNIDFVISISLSRISMLK